MHDASEGAAWYGRRRFAAASIGRVAPIGNVGSLSHQEGDHGSASRKSPCEGRHLEEIA
jgi:hypothetical protein